MATLQALHAFEQHKAGLGPRSPWQRIAGTVVGIGIDYFLANPQAMGKDSGARRVVETFLVGIQDIDFAEGDPLDVVGVTLRAGLQVLGDNATLVSNDARIRALLGGVTASLRDDLRAAGSPGGSLGLVQRREELFKRITASIVRGGATAVAGNADLFIRGDGKATAVVRATVAEVLEGVRDREDLFSTGTIEALFTTALTAPPGAALFSGAATEAILQAALQAVGLHAGTLVDPAHPERQVVADAVAAVAHGLASELAGGVPARQLLSTAQIVHLTRSVLLVAARDPEHVLGAGGDPRRTALSQVLGSVAGALAGDRMRLVSGDTFVNLGRTALAVALKNRDKLLDLNSADPRTNLLFKSLDAVAGAALAGGDARRLVDRDMFLELARRVLPVVSADVGPVLQRQRIAKLDERLWPNAYAIRAVSEWRTGRLAEARATAQTGQKLPNVAGSPRDEMVLMMIPALVIDEELVMRFKQAGAKLFKKEHDERYAADFATAANAMQAVAARARPSTPDSIINYIYLQQWRMLQNWRIVITSIEGPPEVRDAARADAERRLGAPLDAEIKRIDGLVPPGDPIRKTMEALRLR